MRGHGPQRGQEGGGTVPGPLGPGVGAVAQGLVVPSVAAHRETSRDRGRGGHGVGVAFQRRLVRVRELAQAGERGGVLVARRLGVAPHPVHLGEQGAVHDRRGDASGAFQGPEEFPTGPVEVGGERLHVEGAARRVDDPGQVGLFDEHRLGVAGDPSGEVVGATDRRVEGRDGDRVGPADTGREAGHGGAEHVHVRVAAGEHRLGGGGVHTRPATVGGHARGLQDLVPHGTDGAELGDDGELVGVGGQPELDPTGGVGDVDPGLDERPQVGGTGGDGRADLLGDRAARVVHQGAVGDEQPQVGEARGVFGGETGRVVDLGTFTGQGRRRERVQPQVGDDPTVGHTGVGVDAEQGRGRFQGLRAGGAQDDRGQVQVDVGEGLGQAGDRQPRSAHVDPQGSHAVHQVVVRATAEYGRVGVGVPGPDVPPLQDPAAGTVTAGEGGDPGKAGIGRRRGGCVEGFDVEPVQGGGVQHRLRGVGEPFLGHPALAQHTRDELAPPLTGGRGEALRRVEGLGGPALWDVHTSRW